MNLLSKLFNKTPSATDIRLHLKEIEREQRNKRRDLEVMEQTKGQKVQEAVAAKKAGRQEVLRDVFREMRQAEIDWGHVNEDLRRLSLAKTALTSFLRRVEMLERSKDSKSLQNLMVRFRNSPIQKTIDAAEIDNDTFNGLLAEILGEEELAGARTRVGEDPGFAEFDRAIEDMARAEEAGAHEPLEMNMEPEVHPTHRDLSNIELQELTAEDRRRMIDDLKREIDQLQKKIDEKKRQAAELRAQAARQEAEAANMEQDRKSREAKLGELQKDPEIPIEQIRELQRMIENIMENLEDMKRAAIRNLAQADQLDAEAASLEADAKSKERQIADLRADLA
jgi:hypothetical protein